MNARDDDRDPPDGDDDELDETGVYTLDLEEDGSNVDELTREALQSVQKARGAAATVRDELAAPDTGATSVEEELEESRQRVARALADLENFRKRAEREREEARRFAVIETVRAFLPVMDNLDRALTASGSVEDVKAGIELITRQMRDALRQRGVEPVPAIGEEFDPAVHEAVRTVPDDQVEVPTVIEEMQTGFSLGGRLLRPAMVTVAMPTGGGAGSRKAGGEGEATDEGSES